MDVVLDGPKPIINRSIFLNPQIAVGQFGLDLGMEVADFGAGGGHFTRVMANLIGGSGKLSAIDIRDSSLEIIDGYKKIQGLFQIQTIKGNLEKKGESTLKDNSQDFVLGSNILHQTQNPKAILEEAFRVLKSGGKLLIIDWFEKGIMGPPSRISKITVTETAGAIGFVEDKSIDVGSLHYGIMFKKP